MNNQAVISEIEALDERRARATVECDLATLEPMLGDDLRYVHSSAVDEDKTLYLQRLRDGHYRYLGLTNMKRSVRVVGDVVLVNGDVRIEVEVDGKPKLVMSRYLQVWARRQAGWQMISWQSTPIPVAVPTNDQG
jgi:ketosteroid isomerase-like protein